MADRRQDVRGPLAGYAAGFAAELVRRGYSPSAVRLRLWLLDGFSRWLQRQDIAVEQLTQGDVTRFTVERRASGMKSWVSTRSMALPLSILRSIGAVPAACRWADGPADALLGDFTCYLRQERGLAVTTVSDYERWARRFLTRRIKLRGCLELDTLDAGDVLDFVRTECATRPVPSAQHAMSAVRSFLRYLRVSGRISASLTGAVPPIAARRRHLPKALPAGDVERLFASCDLGRPVGLRDYAILLLLARLGLRVGEVAAMRLADVDWRVGEILVRGKGNRHERLPLPVDVGAALAEYVQHVRPPQAGPSMFTRVNAPCGPLAGSGVGAVVHDACVRAGMAPVGAHRLRHTLATGLLRGGASLPEVAEVLRHRHLLTTSIYAKVDRDSLRPLARAWPEAGAS